MSSVKLYLITLMCIGHCVRVVLDHHCVATVYFSKFTEEFIVCMCMLHIFIL